MIKYNKMCGCKSNTRHYVGKKQPRKVFKQKVVEKEAPLYTVSGKIKSNTKYSYV